MYHVVANIDSRFKNANEALVAYIGVPIEPAVPETRAEGEDKTTPRICVCKRLEDCFTAILSAAVFQRLRCRQHNHPSLYVLSSRIWYMRPFYADFPMLIKCPELKLPPPHMIETSNYLEAS